MATTRTSLSHPLEIGFTPAGDRGGALTHRHPSGYLSAGALAAIVRGLIDGRSLRAATEAARAILREWEGHEETDRAIDAALTAAARGASEHTLAVASLGEGWVGEEALAIGLYAALVADSFTEAVRIAANHDGDSDSTASIAGQLYGAWRGLAEIPHDWVVDLDVLEPLLRLARLRESRQADDPLTEAIDWAVGFIDHFETPAEPLYVDHPSTRGDDGVVTLGWRELSPVASAFLMGLSDHGLIQHFDWPGWEAGRAYLDDPTRIERASVSDSLKLLTAHARADRFTEGHFGAMLERGDITAILRRLRALRESGASPNRTGMPP